jgi:hypothetical protein
MSGQAEVTVPSPVPATGKKLNYPADLMGAALRVREIRKDLATLTVAWKSLVGHIAQAYDQRDWVTLGYQSWREYVTAEFDPAHLPRAPKDELAAVVRNLATAESRMSTRAIADALGISQSTAARLSRSPGESDDSPDGQGVQPRKKGLDGKRHPARRPRPESAQPGTVEVDVIEHEPEHVDTTDITSTPVDTGTITYDPADITSTPVDKSTITYDPATITVITVKLTRAEAGMLASLADATGDPTLKSAADKIMAALDARQAAS